MAGRVRIASRRRASAEAAGAKLATTIGLLASRFRHAGPAIPSAAGALSVASAHGTGKTVDDPAASAPGPDGVGWALREGALRGFSRGLIEALRASPGRFEPIIFSASRPRILVVDQTRSARRALRLRLVLLALLTAPLAAHADGAAEGLSEADAALASAPAGLPRLAALGVAVSAVEAAAAEMREGLRRDAAREAALEASAVAARDASSMTLARIAARAAAPLAAQAVQPAGPLAAARGAWLAAAYAPQQASEGLARDADLAALREAGLVRRGALTRMRAALAALQTARADLSAAIDAGGKAPRPARLEEARDALRDFEAAAPDITLPETPLARPPAPGDWPPPAPGRIAVPFGHEDALGQPAAGLTLAAPRWAPVVSPRPATVRYAGPAPGHALAVILETAPGRLLILAGLEGLSVRPGEVVPAGAPVGRLASPNDGHLAVIAPASQEFWVESPMDGEATSPGMLYVEMRKDGTPVDPAAWFAFPQRKGPSRHE